MEYGLKLEIFKVYIYFKFEFKLYGGIDIKNIKN